MQIFGLYVVTILALALTWIAPAEAMVRDERITGARECTRHFARQERLHGIPVHLLAAIANTETGRYHKGLGMLVPWPWTINAAGKGYFFNSKAEAIAKVREYQRRGVNSIDVGCMQVNLRHHAKAFPTLEHAFNPAHNVAYAAKFLRQNYESEGNWAKAAAAYHSKTPKFGNRYLKKVSSNWAKVMGKVRQARINNYAYQQHQKEFAAVASGAKAVRRSVVPTSSNAASAPPRKSMKVINVSEAKPRTRPNIMVIRPTNNTVPHNAVPQQPVARPAPNQQTAMLKGASQQMVNLNKGENSTRPSRQPVFVFE